MGLPEMVAFVVANSGYTFEQVGEMTLPQFRAVQGAVARRIKMTLNPFSIFGAAVTGRGPARRGAGKRVELSPDQFEQVVRDRKRSLGKETLSLEEVF